MALNDDEELELIADHEAELNRAELEIERLKEELEQIKKRIEDKYDRAMKNIC